MPIIFLKQIGAAMSRCISLSRKVLSYQNILNAIFCRSLKGLKNTFLSTRYLCTSRKFNMTINLTIINDYLLICIIINFQLYIAFLDELYKYNTLNKSRNIYVYTVTKLTLNLYRQTKILTNAEYSSLYHIPL